MSNECVTVTCPKEKYDSLLEIEQKMTEGVFRTESYYSRYDRMYTTVYQSSKETIQTILDLDREEIGLLRKENKKLTNDNLELERKVYELEKGFFQKIKENLGF